MENVDGAAGVGDFGGAADVNNVGKGAGRGTVVVGLCFSVRRALNYTPGSDEHGPRLTGGPGAAPGSVTSKNGQGHMRVRVLGVPYSRRCLRACVCVSR